MATLEALERRLQEVEAKLHRQRRWAAALAALAVVGCVAALRPPGPEVLRAQRLEIVDGKGQVVGAFGLGDGGGPSTGAGIDSCRWYLHDPASEAGAWALLGEAETLVETGGSPEMRAIPAVSMGVWCPNSWVDLSATELHASISLLCGEERYVDISAQDSRSEIRFEGPAADASEDERVDVLRLSHTTGKPTIQGWDDQGNPTLDIK